MAASGTVGGLVLGAVQAHALRGSTLRRRRRWIASTALAIGLAANPFVGIFGYQGFETASLLATIAGGAVYGAVAGLPLLLLSHPPTLASDLAVAPPGETST
jgi:hypothetical protein